MKVDRRRERADGVSNVMKPFQAGGNIDNNVIKHRIVISWDACLKEKDQVLEKQWLRGPN